AGGSKGAARPLGEMRVSPRQPPPVFARIGFWKQGPGAQPLAGVWETPPNFSLLRRRRRRKRKET
ncbi:MAG TPA: hypothetical protein VKB35_12990, partial [Ktedonobacteraceae bacterium]|nr:hypothetical protein [Ktedonobacteraceae bacterium]